MTVIVYMTKHGTTQKVANMIQSKYPFKKVELINLAENKNPDLNAFENIIIGGSIHAGVIQKRIKNFCENNKELLLSKKLGLYLCCMEQGDKAILQLKNSFPEELRKHAKCTEILGGEFLFEKMNFVERAVVKKVSGIHKTVSRIKQDSIEEFANTFCAN